jgi:aminoglycoside/choline kinase family phosphotransferase
MPERETAIRSFLEAQGWGAARRRPLAGDASFRHYERVTVGSRRAVLMNAPPSHEDIGPYVSVARLLRGLGYSAPEIYAEDRENGLLLIEDLGDDTYTRILDRDGPGGGRERVLYERAVDLLIDLHHRRADRVTPGIPPYDDRRLLEEAVLLVDWYLPAMRGEETPPELRTRYLDTWMGLIPAARRVAETLVLRDYHVDNLMWLEGRAGVAVCGILDFQDAVRGPVAYDLASLLEDARRDIPAALVSDMKARYRDAFPALDWDAFAASYAILGAQRNCKIIGIFTRLAVRDKKPAYLHHIPRVWRLLEGDLEHPALAPMKDWLDAHVPPADREIPPCRTAA